jgi:hypothetical protein
MSEAALMLHMDYTLEEKHDLLINFIQLGIDIYSFIESGSSGWPPDGGHSGGRKWPIMFAGLMLDYAPMKNIGQKSGDYLYADGHGPGNWPSNYIHFGEDGQTHYVTQEDIDRTRNTLWVSDQARQSGRYLSFNISTNTFTIATPGGATVGPWNPDTRNQNYSTGEVLCHPFTQAMLGMPEWGIIYSTNPYKADSSWSAMYKTVNTSAWAGTALAARTMGVKTSWNHNAYFDFVDRYMAIAKGQPDPFGYTVHGEKAGMLPTTIIDNMWTLYRGLY